ncbi:ABC transporter permease [Ruminococcus sp.]|uniref:ABC transporter permease n=1 Tax=Ruminococcus sp. TaxID=41978 RepID=UPI00386AB456
MGKLLSFELRKLFKNKSFYIWTFVSVGISLIYLLCSFGMFSIQSASPDLQAVVSPESGMISIIKFFSLSPVTVFMLMFICSFVCNDFDNGILKNIISRGYSRGSIFTAKFIAVMVSTAFMVILNLAAIFAVSTALYNDAGTMYELFIPQIIFLVLGLMAFAGIFFMLCVIFKKGAPAIVISLLALLALPIGLSLIATYLHIDFDFSTLWLGGAVSNLATVGATLQTLIFSAVCIVAYLVVSYIVSVSMVKKMEV